MFFSNPSQAQGPALPDFGAGDKIVREFSRYGESKVLTQMLEAAVQGNMEANAYQTLFYVMHELFDTTRGAGSGERAGKFFLYLLEGFSQIPDTAAPKSDARGSGRSARSSGEGERNKALAEAERITRQAQDEADQITNEAKAEAERMTRLAQDEADQITSEAKAEAERMTRLAQDEAEQITSEAKAEAERMTRKAEGDKLRRAAQDRVQPARDSARLPVDKVHEAQSEAQKDDLVPRAVRELVEEYRKDDAEAYRVSEDSRKKLLWDLEQEHSELCAQVKELQANIIGALNSTQNDLCDYMTRWREAFYKKEVMDLAECCVDLHKMLNKLDAQIAEASAVTAPSDKTGGTSGTSPRTAETTLPDGAAVQPLVEQLGRIRRNLNRFAKRFRNAVFGVGLDVYTPVAGDRFDPAQHTLEESDGENDMLEGREIAGCKVPGVRMPQRGGAAGGFEALIRAEVTLKQEGSR